MRRGSPRNGAAPILCTLYGCVVPLCQGTKGKESGQDAQKEHQGGTKALTKAQIAEIQMNIPKLKEPRERLVMALLAYTSMRREELLGLRWENVDLDNRQIHICQAVTYPKSKPIVKGTKTESSIRDLPIADALFTVLEPLVQENGYVIPGRGDRPVSEPTFRRMWKSIGEQIDL